MSMRDSLSSILLGVDGAIAAIIMGYDGIPVDEAVVEQSDFDTQLLSVEYATLLKEVKRSVDVIKAGGLEEVSISTSQTRVMMRVLSEGLFIVLIMKRSGNYGKGSYLLKLTSHDLMRELE